MAETPLTADEIEERLDGPLNAVLSSRRTARAPAESLAGFERAQQEFVLRWAEIIARTNAEMAFQFATEASQALVLMNLTDTEAWIIHAMDTYDKEGLFAGSAVFRKVSAYAAEAGDRARGIAFDEVVGVLEIFIHGLSGRRLKIEASDETCCDTATMYLPRRLYRYAERETNYRLYKCIAAHQWAQTRFGTFRRAPDGENLAHRLNRFDDPQRACALYHALETIRLDACIARELPGLAREAKALQQEAGDTSYPGHWAPCLEQLQRPDAAADTSFALIPAVYDGELPDARVYQGGLQPFKAATVMEERLAREKELLQRALADLVEEGTPQDNAEEAEDAGDREPGPPAAAAPFDVDTDRDGDDLEFEFRFEGRPVAPPPNVRALLESILQDLGEIPPEYLVPAGDGDYDPRATDEKRPEDVWKGTYHEEGAMLYPEWDYRRKHYRKDWCVLRELDVHPNPGTFIADTLRKYHGELQHLRRSFEALRGENRLLRRQPDGENVDLDALVEALADARHGMEMTDRLFTRAHRLERNIAVMFMVDMSGSTKGWINDAERESLVLLCQALEILGDRYAIYGFSGMTRKRCELYRIKRFDEPYSEIVEQRITGIKPQDYTRMGVTIRHLVKVLDEIDARTKLLVTLSDGKPDDFDGYRGEYGIEDTRQALIEAKHAGIHSFCITIDTEARDYLPHMYGAANYTIIDDVRRLPFKVADIYRRLTL